MGKAKFTLEKVKWSWAAPVQSKSVYRDDEFIRSKTKEEALGAIDHLLHKGGGLLYTITVLRDGEYLTYHRNAMPCLGGLVKYKDSHGDRYFMNPYFPRDISVAFPEGDIIYIGNARNGTKDIWKFPFYEFLFSQESPWVSAFNHKDTVIFKDNYFVLTDMNTDPTVFYSLMRLGGFAHHSVYTIQKKDWNPKAEILATKTVQADPRRLAGQKPIKISGGTWAEGYGYTRPFNESIFKTELPKKFKDFASVGSYPQAPYTNKYFVDEMKKKFKVDMTKAVKPDDKKTHDALVDAWAYFKEEAKELTDKA